MSRSVYCNNTQCYACKETVESIEVLGILCKCFDNKRPNYRGICMKCIEEKKDVNALVSEYIPNGHAIRSLLTAEEVTKYAVRPYNVLEMFMIIGCAIMIIRILFA